MASQQPHTRAPRAFIWYSWDDDAHKEWVKKLAARLRADGVDVTLGRWLPAAGDQIPIFMERAVRDNDFVIAVCTPRFKERADARGGGVGYEGDIMTAYALAGGPEKKLIPVLRRGSRAEAAPTWLLERAMIDLTRDPYPESEYDDLLRTLHGAGEAAPPARAGTVPDYFQDEGNDALRSRVEWLERQVGVQDPFFSRHLRVNETTFRQWRNHSASLPPGSEVDLRALWRTVQHLFSILNFDSQRVKTLLQHRVPEVSPGPMAGLAPPWVGSSLIDYLEEHGPRVLPDVDRWVMTFRFGDPYAATPSQMPHPQPTHAS